MLNWIKLTTRQRVAYIFLLALLALFAAGSVSPVALDQVGPASVLEGLAVALLIAAVVLNPNFASIDLRRNAGSLEQFALKNYPPICKLLALGAFFLLLVSHATSALL